MEKNPGFFANIREEPKPSADQKARDCSMADPCDPEEGHCQSDFELLLITVAMTVAGPRTITFEFIKFAVSNHM